MYEFFYNEYHLFVFLCGVDYFVGHRYFNINFFYSFDVINHYFLFSISFYMYKNLFLYVR